MWLIYKLAKVTLTPSIRYMDPLIYLSGASIVHARNNFPRGFFGNVGAGTVGCEYIASSHIISIVSSIGG